MLSFHKAESFVDSQHKVHILNRGTGSAFAQIVKAGDQDHPPGNAENRYFHVITPRKGTGRKETFLVRRFIKTDKPGRVIFPVYLPDDIR